VAIGRPFRIGLLNGSYRKNHSQWILVQVRLAYISIWALQAFRVRVWRRRTFSARAFSLALVIFMTFCSERRAGRIATPYPYGTHIRYFMPIFTDAFCDPSHFLAVGNAPAGLAAKAAGVCQFNDLWFIVQAVICTCDHCDCGSARKIVIPNDFPPPNNRPKSGLRA